MTLVAEQAAFLRDVCKLIEHAAALGFTVTGGELYRPAEMQKLYYERKLTKTLSSQHLKRLAIDLNFFLNDLYIQDRLVLAPLGEFWKSLSPKNVWGGDWITLVDLPHFERKV